MSKATTPSATALAKPPSLKELADAIRGRAGAPQASLQGVGGPDGLEGWHGRTFEPDIDPGTTSAFAMGGREQVFTAGLQEPRYRVAAFPLALFAPVVAKPRG